SSLNLVTEPLRIDDPTACGRNNNLANLNPSARAVDAHIRHDRRAFLWPVLAEGDSTTAHDGLASIRPMQWPGLPAGLLHCSVEHLQSHCIFKVVTTELCWIRLLFGRDFVHEGFNREAALDAARPPKIDRPEQLV